MPSQLPLSSPPHPQPYFPCNIPSKLFGPDIISSLSVSESTKRSHLLGSHRPIAFPSFALLSLPWNKILERHRPIDWKACSTHVTPFALRCAEMMGPLSTVFSVHSHCPTSPLFPSPPSPSLHFPSAIPFVTTHPLSSPPSFSSLLSYDVLPTAAVGRVHRRPPAVPASPAAPPPPSRLQRAAAKRETTRRLICGSFLVPLMSRTATATPLFKFSHPASVGG